MDLRRSLGDAPGTPWAPAIPTPIPAGAYPFLVHPRCRRSRSVPAPDLRHHLRQRRDSLMPVAAERRAASQQR